MALNQDHYLHPFRFDSVYAHKRRAQRSLILDKISDEELHQLIQKNSIVFEQIKSLWIEYASDLSPASYEKIAAMPNLEHLMLSNAEALPLASLKPFGKAPAIRSIYAQHADFTGEDIRNLIPHLRDFSSRSYHFPYGIEYLEELKKIHGEEKDWSEGAHPEFREYEWYDPVTPRGRDIIYEPWRENAMFRILD